MDEDTSTNSWMVFAFHNAMNMYDMMCPQQSMVESGVPIWAQLLFQIKNNEWNERSSDIVTTEDTDILFTLR